MRRVLLAGIAFALVLLAACSPAGLKAVPLNASVQQQAACPANSVLVEGECVCAGGFKECGGACISAVKCCTDADCRAGMSCANGVCKAPRRQCGLNEAWDEKRAECHCADGFKFCQEQGSCIPVGNCCWHADCGSSERCVDTTYSIGLCASENKTSPKCRLTPKDRRESLTFASGRYEITYQAMKEGFVAVLDVNGTRLDNVKVNESRVVGPLELVITHVQEFGGYCRRDED